MWSDELDGGGITNTNPGGGIMTITAGGSPGECNCDDNLDCHVFVLDGEAQHCDIWVKFSFNNDVSFGGNNGWIPIVTVSTNGAQAVKIPVAANPALGSNQVPDHKETIKQCGNKMVFTIDKWQKRNDATQQFAIQPAITFTLECTACDGNC